MEMEQDLWAVAREQAEEWVAAEVAVEWAATDLGQDPVDSASVQAVAPR